MAYRDRAPHEVCVRHPNAAAPAACARCGGTVCEPCASVDGLAITCPTCAAQGRTRRSRTRTAGLVGGLALVGALLLGTGHAVFAGGAFTDERPDLVRQLEMARDEIAAGRPFAASRMVELLRLRHGDHPLFSALQTSIDLHLRSPAETHYTP